MPINPSDDPQLIDHLQFLEELDRMETRGERAGAKDVHSRPVQGDAFEALESGLPLKGAAPESGAPHHEPTPAIEPYQAAAAPPAPAEVRVPFMAAALVIAACLTAGAATAALVFHDQLARITESRTATR